MSNGSRTGFVWHELYMWHDTGTYAGVLPSGHGILEPEENTENAATKRLAACKTTSSISW
jgi:hypothetical protein